MSNPSAASRFDAIYNSTHKAVLILVTSKCRRTADIGDIFQDTYMELYQVLDKRGADYINNDMAFVLRLAKQKIAKYYSLQERMRIFVSLNASKDGDESADISDFQADSFLTEDFVVNQALLEEARCFVQSRPEIVQKVFYLFYDMGLTISEVAEALSIGESNVKNKLYRTLKELRELLK